MERLQKAPITIKKYREKKKRRSIDFEILDLPSTQWEHNKFFPHVVNVTTDYTLQNHPPRKRYIRNSKDLYVLLLN